jgi:viologen exporter family transport system permease protein
MRRYRDYYLAAMKVAILQQLQYRVANYFYLVGMVAEPVIYLVVWSTVALAEGGEVGGYTPGAFAAYYIVGTLVHNMNIVLSPYSWEWRVKHGQLSGELLYPIHPLHHDIAYYAGSNLVTMVFCLPLTAFLAWVFKPVLAPTWYQALAFFFTIWGAYLISTMELSLLGMITFWTTRVAAVVELFFALELLLSGRLVPMTLMPAWVQQLAWYLPFQWTFYFPVESLVGGLSPAQLLFGLSMQALWIFIGMIAINLLWRVGIRRYTAVGN